MQTFMKSNRTRFRATIIYNVGSNYKRRHTRDCDNMTMVLLDHRWEEFSYHPEVRDSINLESLPNDLLCALQNG
jgi:hypothetical protein